MDNPVFPGLRYKSTLELYLRTAEDREKHFSPVHSPGKHAAPSSTCAATAIVLGLTFPERLLYAHLLLMFNTSSAWFRQYHVHASAFVKSF